MIRLAQQKDIPQINVLRKQVNDLHVEGRPDIFKPGFGEELQNHIYVYIDSDNKYLVVDDRDGLIVGMAMVDYILKPENAFNLERRFVHVSEICVHQDFRRQGIAHQLLEYIKADAATKGYDKIELDVWAFNDAQTFYEAEGFSTYRRYMELDLK